MTEPIEPQGIGEKMLHDLEIRELKEKAREANERYKHTLSLLKDAKDQLDSVLQIKDKLAGNSPKHIAVEASGESESTAVLVASDWHLEERVDAKTVDGINRYNPKIAEQRAVKFFQNGLSMVVMCRSRSKIDTLVLGVLGDMITGYIHEELAESNYLSPTEAILKAHSIIEGGIRYLLKEGKFKRIIVPCLMGNHGRTTKKMRVSTATKNSYEWLLYQFLAKAFADEERVQFRVAEGYFVFVDVYKTKLRFHHGDDVRYEGGVGGLTIPLNKAIAQWNKTKRVDVDVLGHWHTRINSRDFVVNGSLIGYTPFAIRIKASYEPPSQSFFLVHPEKGKTVEVPIFVGG